MERSILVVFIVVDISTYMDNVQTPPYILIICSCGCGCHVTVSVVDHHNHYHYPTIRNTLPHLVNIGISYLYHILSHTMIIKHTLTQISIDIHTYTIATQLNTFWSTTAATTVPWNSVLKIKKSFSLSMTETFTFEKILLNIALHYWLTITAKLLEKTNFVWVFMALPIQLSSLPIITFYLSYWFCVFFFLLYFTMSVYLSFFMSIDTLITSRIEAWWFYIATRVEQGHQVH